ncbi:MAG TPA: hypothetical protein DCE41_33880 [Cytophagales bacterium]|nr:hypothetical protein [Cytophagales bacterium]HAA17985.1 hypothetical protein [Cytophagales bacterium]HAP64730.1 hypothetical protein [Cytophagales bacterium]
MNRGKKIFLLIAVLFLVAVGVVSYDISSRTSAPWEKGNLKSRISEEYGSENEENEVTSDSTKLSNE